MTIKATRIERYYDAHLREDEKLGQSAFQQNAMEYLLPVLRWLYHGQRVGVTQDVNFYHTADVMEESKSLDLAVVDNWLIEELDREAGISYYIGEDGPPPRMMIEFSSKTTWDKDLEEKPFVYSRMGVIEYFAFDPNIPTYWRGKWTRYNRLIGWRLSDINVYELIPKDEQGRLWSEQLNSWLVVDEHLLKLYTADGQLRITAPEHQAQLERQRTEMERQQAETERQRAETEHQRAEAEKARAEAQQQRAERLAERLRQLGENPDEL